jgi:hypothetical protein
VLDVNAASSNQGQFGAADPPIRIVKVAQGFGENGTVQSICQKDYAPALDQILKVIAKQLGAACLPRPLTRTADGTVGCNVVWELPPPGTAPSSTPTACHQAGFGFLLDPAKGAATTTHGGGAICRVAQMAVMDTGGTKGYVPTITDGTMFADGWYYDDFSDEVKKGCTGPGKQRVAFTNDAKPPIGVTVKLECLNEIHTTAQSTGAAPNSCSVGAASASADLVGKPCQLFTVPAGGFDDQQVYIGTSNADCGGGVCMVYRLRGDPRAGCVASGPPAGCASGQSCSSCASPVEVQDRVYCSCRCAAPDGYAACACPVGYTCVAGLEQGSAELRGGYCTKNGTFVR